MISELNKRQLVDIVRHVTGKAGDTARRNVEHYRALVESLDPVAVEQAIRTLNIGTTGNPLAASAIDTIAAQAKRIAELEAAMSAAETKLRELRRDGAERLTETIMLLHETLTKQ